MLLAGCAATAQPTRTPFPTPDVYQSLGVLDADLQDWRQRIVEWSGENPSLIMDSDWNRETVRLIREDRDAAEKLAAKYPEHAEALKALAEAMESIAVGVRQRDEMLIVAGTEEFMDAAEALPQPGK